MQDYGKSALDIKGIAEAIQQLTSKLLLRHAAKLEADLGLMRARADLVRFVQDIEHYKEQ